MRGHARALGLRIVLVLGLVGVVLVALFLPGLMSASTATAQSCTVLPPGQAGAPAAGGPVREQQLANAKVIDDVATRRGLPGQAVLVALMTALQESSLINLDHGDRDSLGLFQQRPSAGWGTPEQVMDPTYAAEAFFGGQVPPAPRGLVEVDGWPQMAYTVAAQAVQHSAYPDAYARHEQTARELAAAAGIDLARPGDPYAGRGTPAPGTPALPGAGTGSGSDAGTGTGVDAGPGCGPTGPINGTWPPEPCSISPDLTTGRGCITPRMSAVLQLIQTQPHTAVSCWDEHAWNPNSDHPLGRACDVFFGPGGQLPPPEGKAQGDALAQLMTNSAAQYGISYVIWSGRIWVAEKADQGWQPYNGGGVYDPSDVVGGHYDHVHISVH